MNFKNLSLFALLLVISGHTVMQSEFQIAYIDMAQLISRIKRVPMLEGPKVNIGAKVDVGLLGLAREVYTVSGVSSNIRRRFGQRRHPGIELCVVDSARHHIWYNDNDDKYSSNEKLNVADVLLEPIIFAAANESLRVGLDKLNEYDVVRDITQSIPDDHDNFICRNSRMVAAAFVARGGRILIQEGVSGLNSENGKKFLEQAGMQVGSELTEVYIVNPIVDEVVGNDDCLSGDLLKVGLNLAAFYALSSLMSGQK